MQRVPSRDLSVLSVLPGWAIVGVVLRLFSVGFSTGFCSGLCTLRGSGVCALRVQGLISTFRDEVFGILYGFFSEIRLEGLAVWGFKVVVGRCGLRYCYSFHGTENPIPVPAKFVQGSCEPGFPIQVL